MNDLPTLTPTIVNILEYLLQDHPTPHHNWQIANDLQMSGGTTHNALNRLHTAGLVIREWEDDQAMEERRGVRRRYYRLAPDAVDRARNILKAVKADR